MNLIRTESSGLQFGCGRLLTRRFLHTRGSTPFTEGPVIIDPFEIDEHSEAEVIELEGGRGYAFDYALPLNGEWSDLTAQFEFYKWSDGSAVVLNDLHVL